MNRFINCISSEFTRYSIFFFLASIFISRLLWFGMDDTLPKIPLLGNPTYSQSFYYFDNIFCFLAIVFVCYGVWTADYKRSLWIGILMFFTTFLLDVKRLNALFYFYVCIWILYWFSLKKFADFKHMHVFLIAGLYAWSGIHKINPFFFETNYQWLMEIYDITKVFSQSKFLSNCVVYGELFAGVGLLFNRWRKLSAIILNLMHVFIIFTLVKAGWNLMVIPWNIFMILGLFSIFNLKFDLKATFLAYNLKIKSFLILTSVILPFLFLLDLINPAFSYVMYSGRNIAGSLIVDSADIPKLKSSCNEYISPYYESLNIMDINYLSPDVNNAPFNYSEFVFKRIFQTVTKDFNKESTALILTKYPLFSDSAVYEYVYLKDN